MMDNYNELFDKEIRSNLQDAEGKVPFGVWKGVSSRIPSIQSFDWRRVGLIAAAAVICCCLVLVGTFNRREDKVQQTVTQPVILAEVMSANTVEEFRQNAISIKPVRVSPSGDMPSADAEKPDADSVSETSREVTIATFEQKKDIAMVSDWQDSFPEDNPSQKKNRGVSLDVKGAFSTNKSTVQLGSKGIQGSPSVITGGIEELSESSYGLPFTIGVGVRWYLGKRFSLGSGVDYSLLTRKFTGNYYPKDGSSIMLNSDIHHSLSYIGIPVNVYFDIIQHSLVGFYVFGGAEIERAVANDYRISNGSTTQYYKEAVSGCQYSTQLGLGVEFKVTDFMGIYFDPCLKFYFNSDQPTSMRTQQPLMFSGAIGVKFDLLKK